MRLTVFCLSAALRAGAERRKKLKQKKGDFRAISTFEFPATISVAELPALGDTPNDWYGSAGWRDGYATVLSHSLPLTQLRASSASPLARDLQTPRTIYR